MPEDLHAQLRALVGERGPVQAARHPVTQTAIADWCDAMGDTNPVYTDEAAATASRHGQVVAPPATLDIWDRPGLPAQPRFRPPAKPPAADPRSKALALLDGAGYVGVVAVNSELELVRYPRPGDVLRNTQILEDVSAEKQTALGVGHFVTTRQRYETAAGEHVGDLLFRILKFKPGTGSAAAPDTAASLAAPDPDPARRPRPSINRDNRVLFEGYRAHELRVPQCRACGRLFFPPSPRCSGCGAFDMGYAVSAGRGNIYSFCVVHHPQVPGFRYPLVVALVELEEGVRLVGDLVGVPPAQASIGMPVEVEWLDAGEVTVPQFRPATPPRRDDTRRRNTVRAGDPLPLWVLPLTPTHIVAGAIATRDFQDVHHDRDLAHRKGSEDIFLNINTSLGYLQRYVTDWTGPDVQVTALRVRLGAPAYPYLPLTFTGAVTSIDAGTGRAVVAVQAVNERGPHITGTVELELPS